ncbi:MAG: hypothetical protein EPO02_13330 [Nitrospirae bacterium]|nr:MAG: hypothetical protein EPO02_13330 [Nitrospirota bacterium]
MSGAAANQDPTGGTALPFDDGMTDLERAYFSTGGDDSGGKLLEQPAAPPAPAAPAAPAVAPTAPAQPGLQTALAPAEEPDPGDEPDPTPGKPPRRVSYRKFQAEEQRRQALETQVQTDAIARAKIEERLNLLTQALTPPQQPDPATQPKPKPNRDTDILAYMDWLEEQLTGVTAKVTNYEQQIQVGQAEQEEQGRYISSLNEYAATDPNFLNAYAYLWHHRKAELLVPMHPGTPFENLMAMKAPPAIQDQLRAEEQDVYKSAFGANRNPAADTVAYARARGFRPPAAQPAVATAPAPGAAPAAPARTNGAAVPAQPATPAQPQPANASELIEQILRGQGAATSLSNAAGGSGIELTGQMLGDMPQDQFEELYNVLLARGDMTRLKDLMGH